MAAHKRKILQGDVSDRVVSSAAARIGSPLTRVLTLWEPQMAQGADVDLHFIALCHPLRSLSRLPVLRRRISVSLAANAVMVFVGFDFSVQGSIALHGFSE